MTIVMFPQLLYKNYEVMLFADPNRFRATIWAPSKTNPRMISLYVKTLWSKDKIRLISRAKSWIDKKEMNDGRQGVESVRTA